VEHGTTKEKVASRARMIEAALINDAKHRELTVMRRSPSGVLPTLLAMGHRDATGAEIEAVLPGRMKDA